MTKNVWFTFTFNINLITLNSVALLWDKFKIKLVTYFTMFLKKYVSYYSTGTGKILLLFPLSFKILIIIL